MKCEESKKLVYLYDELTSLDREKIDAHVQGCKSCQSLFIQLREERQFVKNAFNQPLRRPDFELTNRIMTAIRHESGKQSSWITSIIHLVNRQPLRYSLAAISFFLVAFFVFETSSPEQTPVAVSTPVPHDSVELNSSMFFKELKESVTSNKPAPTTLSLYECIKTCRANEAHVKCADCKIKLIKLRTYENI